MDSGSGGIMAAKPGALEVHVGRGVGGGRVVPPCVRGAGGAGSSASMTDIRGQAIPCYGLPVTTIKMSPGIPFMAQWK